MADVLEKKIGDLVRELESRRDSLKRELEKVSAQIELIAGLVGTPMSSPKRTVVNTPATKTQKVTTKKRKRGRPAKKSTVASTSNNGGAKSERTLKDELVSIAKSHGGILRVREASQSLVKSGRYSTKEQAAANIYQAIKYYKGAFVRDNSTRGTYKVRAKD